MGRAKTRKLRNAANRYLQGLPEVQREVLNGASVRTLVAMASIEKFMDTMKLGDMILGVDWAKPGGDRNGNVMVGPYSVMDAQVVHKHMSIGCVVDPVTCSICGVTLRTRDAASEHFSRGPCSGPSHIELDWHMDASGNPVFDSISLCAGPDPQGITDIPTRKNPEA